MLSSVCLWKHEIFFNQIKIGFPRIQSYATFSSLLSHYMFRWYDHHQVFAATLMYTLCLTDSANNIHLVACIRCVLRKTVFREPGFFYLIRFDLITTQWTQATKWNIFLLFSYTWAAFPCGICMIQLAECHITQRFVCLFSGDRTHIAFSPYSPDLNLLLPCYGEQDLNLTVMGPVLQAG
jgi:hypothetical protein